MTTPENLGVPYQFSIDSPQFLTGKQLYVAMTVSTYDTVAQSASGGLVDFAMTYRLTYTDM